MQVEKSLLFSCAADGRKALRRRTARGDLGTTVPVFWSFRDLGPHLDTTKRATASLLNGRFTRATQALRDAAHLKMDARQREEFLRLKAFGMWLSLLRTSSPGLSLRPPTSSTQVRRGAGRLPLL